MMINRYLRHGRVSRHGLHIPAPLRTGIIKSTKTRSGCSLAALLQVVFNIFASVRLVGLS